MFVRRYFGNGGASPPTFVRLNVGGCAVSPFALIRISDGPKRISRAQRSDRLVESSEPLRRLFLIPVNERAVFGPAVLYRNEDGCQNTDGGDDRPRHRRCEQSAGHNDTSGERVSYAV